MAKHNGPQYAAQAANFEKNFFIEIVSDISIHLYR
jgi:hypothetical protein